MTKRPRKIHFLFKGGVLCGISGPKDKRNRKPQPIVATKSPEQVTCISCIRASDFALKTSHRTFLDWVRSKEKE